MWILKKVRKRINPDFAVDLVMRVPNTIKTSVSTDFLAEDVMDYMEVKKIKQMPCLK